MNVPRHLQFPLALLVLALVVTALVYQFPVTSVLDVGSGREQPFLRGFSFRENLPDTGNARWSAGQSEINFVGVGAQDGTLTLRYAAPRPSGVAQVTLRVNGAERPPPSLPSDFQTHEIPVSRADIGIGGDISLTLDSDTFTSPPDTRQLGVLFDSAQFRANGAPVIPSPRALLYVAALTVLAFYIGKAWSGNARVGLGAGVLTIVLGAVGLMQARVETAYYIAPLFWTGLFLFGLGYLFAIALQRLTNVLPAPPLTARTLRLVFVMMVAAFALRMVFAVTPGYIVDVQDYIVWSYKTVTYGLGTMYLAVDGLWMSDQSVGLNYILHLMGLIQRTVFAPDFLYPVVAGDPALRGATDNAALLADPIHRTLLRLPMLFSDVLTGALVFAAARKYLSEPKAWLVGLAFWFNPAVIWNGAYWGQTDAMHTLLALVSFLLILFTPRVGLAFFILGVAVFIKPQPVFFGPLLLLGAYRQAQVQGVVRALVGGVLGSAALIVPMFLTGGLDGLLAFVLDAVGHNPTLSANAHNLWWMLFGDNIGLADTAGIFPGAVISFRAASILLFLAANLIVLVKAWRAPLEQYFFFGAFVIFTFFMLPTEIHENYAHTLFPLLAVAMARDTRLVALFVALTVTVTLNYALHDPPVFALLQLTDPNTQLSLLRRLNATVNVLLLSLWLVYVVVRNDLGTQLTPFRRQAVAK